MDEISSLLPEPTFRTPTVPAPRLRPTLTTAPAAESPRTAGLDTPGKFLKEGVRFLPKFDLTAMADMLKTPEACRRPTAETPLTEKVIVFAFIWEHGNPIFPSREKRSLWP